LRGAAQQRHNDHGINPRVRFSPDGTRILAICGENGEGVSEWTADHRSVRRPPVSPLLQVRRRDRRPMPRRGRTCNLVELGDQVLASRVAKMEELELETPSQFLSRAASFARSAVRIRPGRLRPRRHDGTGDDRVAFEASNALTATAAGT